MRIKLSYNLGNKILIHIKCTNTYDKKVYGRTCYAKYAIGSVSYCNQANNYGLKSERKHEQRWEATIKWALFVVLIIL
jgi:hypothetical protein